MSVTIEWWGTAAFKMLCEGFTILTDPYLTRNRFARPKVNIGFDQTDTADLILISHGHFDHIMDIPEILKRNTKAHVWGPPTAMENIRKHTTKTNYPRLHDIINGLVPTSPKLSEKFEIRAQLSRHVKFDMPLVATTIFRALTTKERKRYFRPTLLTEYPCGETLTYALNLDGTRIRFLGSAGPTDAMLDDWAHTKDDYLLVPLQGNSRICEIGAEIVERLKPRAVIPHHHDDFYPPVSQMIDITPFKKQVIEKTPATSILELEIGRPQTLSSLASHNGQPRLTI